MGPSEPYWQTNTSFSPPLSRRWDHRSQSEGLTYGSHGGSQLYGSSLSSNSKDSRSWVRGDQFPSQHYSPSDGVASYFSSPSDSFQAQQLTPPLMEGVNVDEYDSASMREPASGLLADLHSTEGTSTIPYSVESISSHSDASEYEPMSRTLMPSHRNFSGRSFMSKPVHPLSFPNQTLERESQMSVSATNSNKKPMHGLRRSSAGSVDFTDVSEQLDQESMGFSYNLSEGSECGLCGRLLSQRSPWSSLRIVRSGDLPIAGVLSCWHVYHAECLDQTTPKTQKHDPPCPQCTKSGNIPDKLAVCRLKNGTPCVRSFGEDGPSRAWSCGQVGDCVEGALHTQARASMLLLNRNRLKKQLSMKTKLAKSFPIN